MLPKWIGYQRVDEGRIVERDTDKIVVTLNPDCAEPTTCATCGGRQSCARLEKPAVITIIDNDPPGIAPGVRVRISHFIFNKTLAALLVFGLPIIFAFSGMIIQQAITGSPLDSVWTIVAGGAGLVLGFSVTAFTDRIIRKSIPAPRIVSVLA